MTNWKWKAKKSTKGKYKGQDYGAESTWILSSKKEWRSQNCLGFTLRARKEKYIPSIGRINKSMKNSMAGKVWEELDLPRKILKIFTLIGITQDAT